MISRPLRIALVSLLAVAGCEQRHAPEPSSKPSVQSSSGATASETAPRAASLSARTRVLEREGLVEPSRYLGGVLPLKHGVFVASDIDCGDPPNAAIRRYDGVGLSGAHTRDCKITVLEKRGASYEIDQSCIDAGSGPAPRSSERATIEVRDNLTFVLKRGGGGDTFRYCAASLLPPGLREWGR